MTTKHTPGPWAIRDDNEDGAVSIVGSSQIVLARVRTATVEPGDANARLIAAAPELLDALQSMVSQFPEAELRADPDLHASVKRARAAIAKAVMQ